MVFGDVIKSWSVPSYITGIAFDGQYLWLSRLIGNEVYCYTRDGVQIKKAFTASWMTSDRLDNMGFDGHYLWLHEMGTENLHCVTRQGDLIKTITRPTLANVTGLTFDALHMWFFGDIIEFERLLTYCNREGVLIKSFRGLIDAMSGLTFDGQYFYMCDHDTETLYQTTKKAVILKTASTPSTYPFALCFDGQYLWHSDFDSSLIYMLSRV